MRQLLVAIGVAALFAGPVLGQASAPKPAFDVASIQVSTRPAMQRSRSGVPVVVVVTLDEATVPSSRMIHRTDTLPVSLGFLVSALS